MEPWLDKKFIEQVLQTSENDDTLSVINISAEPAIKKGENHTSELIRVKIHYSRYFNDKIVRERRSILFKAELTNLRKPLNHDRAFLIMEDLGESGFRMTNRISRLDYEHCRFALRNLAKFHASSVAVCEKSPEYKNVLSKGYFHPNSPQELIDYFFVSRVKSFAKAIASWPDFGESYSSKLMKLSEVITDRVANCQERDDNEFNVINHNDYWTNNMLFKYDGNGRVTDHIMVDFQACFYGSPSIDLAHFFSLCISETVTESQRNELFEEYLETLTSTMLEIGCNTHPPNMIELKKAMHKREIHDLLMSCSILAFYICDYDKLISHDEVYENEIFKREISKKLRRWDNMGLLDV